MSLYTSSLNKKNIMSLENDIMTAIKEAMKAKNQIALAALRAVKSEILLARTSGEPVDLTEEDEIKLVQKLVKQRKDSARIFSEQHREDLSEPELAQAAVLEIFLPKQLSDEEIHEVVSQIIAKTGAAGMKDMGKIMGMANKELAGKADGRSISTAVKSQLI
jgi:hypothetical protein